MSSPDAVSFEASRLSTILTEAVVAHTQLQPCWSCGHEGYFHDGVGCQFEVLIHRAGTETRCACGVPGFEGVQG